MNEEELIQTLGNLNIENDPKFKSNFYENMKKAAEEHKRLLAELENQYGTLVDPETHVRNWDNLYYAYIKGSHEDLLNAGFTIDEFETARAYHIFTTKGLIDALGDVDVESAVKLGLSDECIALGVDPGIVAAWEIKLKGSDDDSKNN